MSLATSSAQRATAEHLGTIDRLRVELEAAKRARGLAERVAVVWHDRAIAHGWTSGVAVVPAQRDATSTPCPSNADHSKGWTS